jgi:hypothetical protein
MIWHNDIDCCKQGSLYRILLTIRWRADVIREYVIHKGVMIVRRCVWTVRELYQLYILIWLAYFQDGEELIQVKTEEVTYIQEEDPLAVTFPAMKAEQGVSCISVCPALQTCSSFNLLLTSCILALVVQNPLPNICRVLYFAGHTFCTSTVFCVVTVFVHLDPLEF